MQFILSHTPATILLPNESLPVPQAEHDEEDNLPSRPLRVKRLRLVQALFGLATIMLMVVVFAFCIPAKSHNHLQFQPLAESGQEMLFEAIGSQIPPLTDSACPNYSPTFPSAGGPDCTMSCPNGSRTGVMAILNPFPDSYYEKIRQAGDVVKSIDPKNTIYLDGRGDRIASHISFSYYCCHTEAEITKIKNIVMKNQDWWQPRRLNLSYVTCAIDGPALDHVSFIILLDKESNNLMMKWVTDLEHQIESMGVPIHLSRRYQEPYHTTVGVVNGSTYPVKKAILELNKRFPPGSWLQEPFKQGKVKFFDHPGVPV